jgi:hypothetical protein
VSVEVKVIGDERYYPEWVVRRLVELVDEWREQAMNLARHYQ